MSKRGLGKGLDALLSTSSYAREKEQIASQSQELSADGELKEISVSHLQPGVYQPRKDMSAEALEELASSIHSQGIIQPIVVRPVGDGFYEIIAGERRWRAARQAGLKMVPCLVKEVQDRAAIAMALIENIQRENLNSIEEAQALERLQNEFKLTHQQVADAVGKSRVAVSNLLRLNQLGSKVKELVSSRQLDMGHARALLALEGEQQSEVAAFVAKRQLTVRQTEQLVKKTLQPPQEKQERPNPTEQVLNLSQRLEDQLKAKVDVDISVKGKARITINLGDNADLENILEKLANNAS